MESLVYYQGSFRTKLKSGSAFISLGYWISGGQGESKSHAFDPVLLYPNYADYTCFRDKQILLHVLGVGTLSRVMKVYIRYELKTDGI